jgi:hypothetical protein
MISRGATIPILLITATHLSGCDDSPYRKPPNVVVSGIVERIERTTRSSMGNTWSTYEVKLGNTDPSDLHYVTVSGRTITDSDLAPSVGQQVSIECYREDLHHSCYSIKNAALANRSCPPDAALRDGADSLIKMSKLVIDLHKCR